jgi:putative polyhydroxyalkanoate system protein
MPDIKLHRDHELGLAGARKIALQWAEEVETKFDMTCAYAQGKTSDTVTFKRSGVDGTLQVTANTFELHAKLGFLLGAFKDKITGEIEKNLDALLAKKAKPAAKKTSPAEKNPTKKGA